MEKMKKDLSVVYLGISAVVTLIATLIAFIYNFVNYFDITIVEVFEKIFNENIYITLYFLLLWILNYLLFEIYKIILNILRLDIKKELYIKIKGKKLISYDVLGLIVILILLLLLNIDSLFKVNFIILIVLMFCKSIIANMKELLK